MSDVHVMKSKRPQDRELFWSKNLALAGRDLGRVQRILDYAEVSGNLVTYRERVEGRPVLVFDAKWQSLPASVRLRIALDVFEALASIHQSGWTHGSVVLGNIRVQEGRAKLCWPQSLTHRAESFDCLQSLPILVPPEASRHFRCLVRQADPARAEFLTEQFLLGTILWTLLANTLPFRYQLRSLERLGRHRIEALGLAVFEVQDRAVLSARVADVLKRMMSPHPIDRFPELGLAYSAFLSGLTGEEARAA